MPENTAMPIAWRISAPAPLRQHQRHDAHDEGEGGHQDRPQTQAAASSTADTASWPRSSCRCLANSTIRIAFLQARPTSTIRPDLREDVVVAVIEQHAGDGREQAHRHDQDDRQRQASDSRTARPAPGTRAARRAGR